MGQSKCLVIPHFFSVYKNAFIHVRSASGEVLTSIRQLERNVWKTKRVTLATTVRLVVIEVETAANSPEDSIFLTNLAVLPHSCDGDQFSRIFV